MDSITTLAFATLLLGACPAPSAPAEPAPGDQLPAIEHESDSVTFAIIGDFGYAGEAAADVSKLVHGWTPEIVITTGDNNYDDGAADTIDANIGQYYHDFISPYIGKYGPGAKENRFFPALGNHDWRTPDLKPHTDYFVLPGNERFYSVSWGPVDVFIVDSDPHEPAGVAADSAQAKWLEQQMRAADGPWKLVVMHHPPYSSGDHGSSEELRWPYAEWGATAVIAGHDHHYERIEQDGILYFVNGLGGNPKRYGVNDPIAGSAFRYNDDHGAMRVYADAQGIVFEFVDRHGATIDTVTRKRGG